MNEGAYAWMFEPLEFTRRGGLPKTGCLLRAKIGFAMAGGGFNVQKQNDEMLTGTSKYR